MRLSLSIVLLTYGFIGQAQSHAELRFFDYLIEREHLSEAAAQYDRLKIRTDIPTGMMDSASFQMTLLAFRKGYDCAPFASEISSAQPLLLERAALGREYQSLESMSSSQPITLSMTHEPPTDSLQQLRYLVNVAHRVLLSPEMHASFRPTPHFETQHKAILALQASYNAQPKKSILVASALSVAIPGLGKAYAGKPKQFLPTLLPTLLFGSQALEAYLVRGSRDPRLWVFGSLAGVFYLGNIYSSAMTVKQIRKHAHLQLHRDLMDVLEYPVQSLLHTN